MPPSFYARFLGGKAHLHDIAIPDISRFVKVTAEELARQYREMGDDELLSLDPDELHELARSCYEGELARRSLKPEASEEELEPEVAVDDDPDVSGEELVHLATFVSRDTAKMAHSALKTAGIPSRLEDDPDGARLMGPPSLEREAHQILSNLDHVSAALTERWLQQALPGRRVIIEELLAQDDLVAVRLTVDGKHQAFCFTRIEGGKVAETWHNFDQLRR